MSGAAIALKAWDEVIVRSQASDEVVSAEDMLLGYTLLNKKLEYEVKALRRDAARMSLQLEELKALSRNLAKQYAKTGGDYCGDA